VHYSKVCFSITQRQSTLVSCSPSPELSVFIACALYQCISLLYVRDFNCDVAAFLVSLHLLHFLLYNLSTAAVNNRCECYLSPQFYLFLLTQFSEFSLLVYTML
jgi:hypothetical protein